MLSKPHIPIAAFLLLFVLALIISFAVAFRAPHHVEAHAHAQAQADAPLLTMPPARATPTAGVPPVAPSLATNPFIHIELADQAAHDALTFDAGVNWQIEDAALAQRGVGRAFDISLDDTLVLLNNPDISADATIRLSAYNERGGVADVLARVNGNSFYRYRVLADSYAEPAHRIELVQDGAVTVLAEVDAPGLLQHRWHSLTLYVRDATLTASFDGELVAQVHDATLAEGTVGFGTLANGGTRFGSLEVTQ